EGREVSRMIFTLAGRAVIPAAGGESSLVEAPHGIAVASLKRQVHVRCGRAVVAERVDPQLIDLKVRLVVGVDRLVERTEHSAIEAFAGGEIPGSQMDVVDEAADVPFGHGRSSAELATPAQGRRRCNGVGLKPDLQVI